MRYQIKYWVGDWKHDGPEFDTIQEVFDWLSDMQHLIEYSPARVVDLVAMTKMEIVKVRIDG